MVSHCDTEPTTPVVPLARKIETTIAGPVWKHPGGSSCARALALTSSMAAAAAIVVRVHRPEPRASLMSTPHVFVRTLGCECASLGGPRLSPDDSASRRLPQNHASSR